MKFIIQINLSLLIWYFVPANKQGLLWKMEPWEHFGTSYFCFGDFEKICSNGTKYPARS